MPKIVISESLKTGKRLAATSMQNMKDKIRFFVYGTDDREGDPEDGEWLTIEFDPPHPDDPKKPGRFSLPTICLLLESKLRKIAKQPGLLSLTLIKASGDKLRSVDLDRALFLDENEIKKAEK